jgi:hypothetical protein
MSSQVEVPVNAVRLAVVLRSARASRPEVERERPLMGMVGYW